MSTDKDLVAKCPECGSAFRLTPQHLQAAKGWVQCGMCGHVFHSGIKLDAEPVAQAPAAPVPPPAPERPAATAPKPVETAAPAMQQAAAIETPPPEIPAEAGAEAAAVGLSGLAQRMAEDQAPVSAFGPKLESIIIVDPNNEADDDYGPMPIIPPPKPAGTQAGSVWPGTAKTESTWPGAAKSESTWPGTPKPAGSVPPSHGTPVGSWGGRREKNEPSTGWVPRQRDSAPVAAKGAKKRSLNWLWAIIILILLAALGAQVFYYMRDKLASNFPGLRPALAQMCDTLGCSLGLPRDPQQVLILGSDLQTENENNLALGITLANRAAHAMAWPVLELTLTDVEDQPIARRMFAPSEYLPSGDMEAKGIQARAEIPFNLQLQGKDIKAAGYRLRMFY